MNFENLHILTPSNLRLKNCDLIGKIRIFEGGKIEILGGGKIKFLGGGKMVLGGGKIQIFFGASRRKKTTLRAENFAPP